DLKVVVERATLVGNELAVLPRRYIRRGFGRAGCSHAECRAAPRDRSFQSRWLAVEPGMDPLGRARHQATGLPRILPNRATTDRHGIAGGWPHPGYLVVDGDDIDVVRLGPASPKGARRPSASAG